MTSTLSDAPSGTMPRISGNFLRNNGRWIVDDTGRVFIYHGVNMISKLPPYTLSAAGFGESSAALLAENGINLVRVGVIFSAVEPAPGVFDEKYLRDIRKTVDMLAIKGISSLIDFHQDGWGPSFICEGFPEWATITAPHQIRPIGNFPELYFTSKAVQTAFDNFWANAPGPDGLGLQDHYAQAWQLTVTMLKDSPGVLGWDLMNEPFPGSKIGNPPTPLLTAFTQKMVNAIRQVDSDHIVWYEPWVSFDEGFPTEIGKIKDPASRIGMSFHNYLPVAEYGKVWQNALDQSAKYGDALLATEFGSTTKASDIQAEMNSIDQWMMSPIYWAYSNRTPYQIAKPDGEPISSIQQGFVYDPALPLVPPNLFEDKFNAFVRPYPMSIVGIPSAWNFDPSSRVFKLEYTANSTAVSEIFAPNRQYPNGYKVSVAGGKGGNVGQLVFVEANSAGARVMVTITPN